METFCCFLLFTFSPYVILFALPLSLSLSFSLGPFLSSFVLKHLGLKMTILPGWPILSRHRLICSGPQENTKPYCNFNSPVQRPHKSQRCFQHFFYDDAGFWIKKKENSQKINFHFLSFFFPSFSLLLLPYHYFFFAPTLPWPRDLRIILSLLLKNLVWEKVRRGETSWSFSGVLCESCLVASLSYLLDCYSHLFLSPHCFRVFSLTLHPHPNTFLFSTTTREERL